MWWIISVNIITLYVTSHVGVCVLWQCVFWALKTHTYTHITHAHVYFSVRPVSIYNFESSTNIYVSSTIIPPVDATTAPSVQWWLGLTSFLTHALAHTNILKSSTSASLTVSTVFFLVFRHFCSVISIVELPTLYLSKLFIVFCDH